MNLVLGGTLLRFSQSFRATNSTHAQSTFILNNKLPTLFALTVTLLGLPSISFIFVYNMTLMLSPGN